MTDVGVSVAPSTQEKAKSWTNKPFGFFTETLPRLYNQAVGRLEENMPSQAMQDAQFYGTAGTVGGPMPEPLPSSLISSIVSKGEPAKQKGTPPSKVQNVVEEPTISAADFLAQYGGQFDGSPYDRAADYMLDRRRAQLEAIQGMYNQYAQEAEANAARVADIYAGSEQGIGETYTGARDLTESAYGSAQQQAADQLARLGIEAAAPAVAEPMALSQAEAVSNLIANQAAGEGAIQRYGATGRDFASSMAQIAQQQAVENQRSATEQLADQLFQLEMERAQAQAAYNPYEKAMQQLEYEQAFNAPMVAQQQAIREAAQLQLDATLSKQDKLVQLWDSIRGDYGSDEEAWTAAQAAMAQAEAQYPIY